MRRLFLIELKSIVKLAFLQRRLDDGDVPFRKWAEMGAEVGVEFDYIRIRTSDFAGNETERRKFVIRPYSYLRRLMPSSCRTAPTTKTLRRFTSG